MVDYKQISIPLQVVDEGCIIPEQDAAIRQLLCDCFASDAAAFSARRAWNEVWPAYSVVAHDGEKIVGQVGIIDRQITCADISIRVAGIQSLAVSPGLRRSGLSQRLMIASMDEARQRGIRFGLLFCLPQLEGFYSRLGWQRIERAVTMLDAMGRTVPLTAKNISMYLALAEAPLPPGPIDIGGRDW